LFDFFFCLFFFVSLCVSEILLVLLFLLFLLLYT